MPRRPGAPRWRPRFSVLSLMLMMLVCAMVGAVGYRMQPAVRQGASPRVFFVFFTLVAPMLLLVIVGLLRQLTLLLNRPRRTAGNPTQRAD